MSTRNSIRVGVLLAVVVGVMTIGLPAVAQVSGTAHDLRGTVTMPGGEICVACHTPHNADTTVSAAPLWNHTVTTAAHTPYSGPSGTLDATVGDPAGISLLCLSCHDGSVALNSFGGAPAQTDVFISGNANFGTDLSNDHPISFTYDTALATLDGGLENPSVATTSLGGTIQEDLLFNDNLECASCHNVHAVGTVGPLLRIDNTASALCSTCHQK